MSGKPNDEIDLCLSVALTITPPGYEWTCRDLAEVVGCSWQYIYQLEHQGLEKLKDSTLLKEHSL